MSHSPVPWIGLVAVVAMFVIPFLPDRLFEGPRTIRHWPQRHVCGACGDVWTSGHACEVAGPEPVLPAPPAGPEAAGPRAAPPAPPERLVGELRRLDR
jgi:hypothetical protein